MNTNASYRQPSKLNNTVFAAIGRAVKGVTDPTKQQEAKKMLLQKVPMLQLVRSICVDRTSSTGGFSPVAEALVVFNGKINRIERFVEFLCPRAGDGVGLLWFTAYHNKAPMFAQPMRDPSHWFHAVHLDSWKLGQSKEAKFMLLRVHSRDARVPAQVELIDFDVPSQPEMFKRSRATMRNLDIPFNGEGIFFMPPLRVRQQAEVESGEDAKPSIVESQAWNQDILDHLNAFGGTSLQNDYYSPQAELARLFATGVIKNEEQKDEVEEMINSHQIPWEQKIFSLAELAAMGDKPEEDEIGLGLGNSHASAEEAFEESGPVNTLALAGGEEEDEIPA